jgi:hypothetical protein
LVWLSKAAKFIQSFTQYWQFESPFDTDTVQVDFLLSCKSSDHSEVHLAASGVDPFDRPANMFGKPVEGKVVDCSLKSPASNTSGASP